MGAGGSISALLCSAIGNLRGNLKNEDSLLYIFQEKFGILCLWRRCDNLRFMKAKKCQNLKSLYPPFLAKTKLHCFSGHFKIASYCCLQNKLNWNHPFTLELAQLETGCFCFSGLHWQGMYRGLIRLRGN